MKCGWRAGELSQHVLVISSDMFNLDSGLGHVLAMLMMAEPGPHSVAAALSGVDEQEGGGVRPRDGMYGRHIYTAPQRQRWCVERRWSTKHHVSSAYTAFHDVLRIVDPAKP
jgi:hypothetical protein